MVNKKAYIKTLEAVFAIVIFLIFISATLVFKQPSDLGKIPEDIKLLQDTILNKIETEPELRECLVDNNTVCINQTINASMIKTKDYNFEICIKPDPSDCILMTNIPTNKTVYSDSLIIQEKEKTALFRLFIWNKLE